MDYKIQIGEMAKLHNISEQTLRYYDKIGLFKPALKDKSNRYRYYSIEQFAHLDSILFLKSLGMSLDEIKQYFKNRDLESITLMLEQKSKLIEKEIKVLEKKRKAINKKIRFLDNYRDREIEKCHIKFVEKRKMVHINFKKSSDIFEFEYGLKELSSLISDELGLFNNIIGTTIDKDKIITRDLEIKKGVALIIEEHMPNINTISLYEGEYAVLVYRGPYDIIDSKLNKLIDWIEENDYIVLGDGIILTITDSAFSDFEDDYITEIQIPVKKDLTL